MVYVYIALGVLVGGPVAIGLLLLANLGIATLRQSWRIAKALDEVMGPIERGQPPDKAAILKLAGNPEFRNWLFDDLNSKGRTDLFPPEHRTVERYAEGVLASWLAHPNELQRAPTELELVQEVKVDSESELGMLRYLLFRFRIDPPSFAAERGWMAGVIGPFLEGSNPPLVLPKVMFSELEGFEKRSPEDHVQVAHRSLLRAGGVECLRRVLGEAKKG